MPGDSSVLMVVILRDGALVGTEAFPPGTYRVGTGDDCDLRLEDEQLAECHASVLFAGGQVGIADEGSATGVFVNGEQVQNAQVTSLDEVRLGSHVLKMRVVTKRKPAAAPAGVAPAPQRPVAVAPPAAPRPAAPFPVAAVPAPAPARAPVPQAAPPASAPRKTTKPIPVVRPVPAGGGSGGVTKPSAPTMLTPRPIPRPAELQSPPPAVRAAPHALNATVPSSRQASPSPAASPAWPSAPPRPVAPVPAAAPAAREELARRARAKPEPDPFGPPDLSAPSSFRREPEPTPPPSPAAGAPAPAAAQPKLSRKKRRAARSGGGASAADHSKTIAAPHPGKAPTHPVLHARILWGDTVVVARSFRAGESVVVGAGEGYPLPAYTLPSPKAQRLARHTRKGWVVFLPADLDAFGRQSGPWRPLKVERNAKGKANVVLEQGQAVRLRHGNVAIELRSEMPAPQIPFSIQAVKKHFDRTMVIPACVGFAAVLSVILLVPKQSDRPDFTPKAMPAIRAILQPPKKKEEKKIEKPKEKTETVAKEEKPVKNTRLPPTKIVKHAPMPAPPQSAALVAVSKLMNQGAAKNQLFAAVEKLGGERGKGGNLNYKSSGLLGKMPLAMNGVGGFGIGGGFGNGMGLTKGAGAFGGLRGLGGPGALSAGGVGHRGVGGAVVSAPARAGKVSGLLPMEAVRRVVDEHINEVRQCYESGLIRNPGVVGKVVLEWTIGTSGSVTQVKTKMATLDSPMIVNCILDRLKVWRFPAPKGGVVVVSYPFLFNSVGN